MTMVGGDAESRGHCPRAVSDRAMPNATISAAAPTSIALIVSTPNPARAFGEAACDQQLVWTVLRPGPGRAVEVGTGHGRAVL